MTVSLVQKRAKIEYELKIESVSFLIIEEHDPILRTANVVKISRVFHRCIHEEIAVGSSEWRRIISYFNVHKQRLIQKTKERQEEKARSLSEQKTESPNQSLDEPKKARTMRARQLTAVA